MRHLNHHATMFFDILVGSVVFILIVLYFLGR
jgi:hypothetical protein